MFRFNFTVFPISAYPPPEITRKSAYTELILGRLISLNLSGFSIHCPYLDKGSFFGSAGEAQRQF